MNKILIILFTFIFAIVGAKGQSYKKSINVNWVESQNIDGLESSLRFEGQSGSNDFGLPVIVLQYPIEGFVSSVDDISVLLNIVDVTALNSIESNFLESLPSEEFEMMDKHIVTIRKKDFLELTITPLDYNLEYNVYNKVTQFTIEVDIPLKNSHSSAKLKSAARNADVINSVLKQGRWVKVSISESGIHKIPYSQLTSWGFSSGDRVKVFGNGGNMLPKANSAERLSDLTENAVMHYNNAIYFYAQGPTTWTYDPKRGMFLHQIHDYADEAYYYLSEDAGVGLEVSETDESYETFTHETDEFDSYAYYELEERNLLHSGRTWYDTEIYPSQQQDYDFKFKNLVKEKPLQLLTEVIGHSNMSSSMETYINGSSSALQSISIPTVKYGDQIGSVAHEGVHQASFYSDSPDVRVTLQYNTSASGAFGNLNFLCLNGREKIVLDKQLLFRDSEVVGSGNITRFKLENTASNSRVWDISDHTRPIELKIEVYEGQAGIITSTGTLKEFALFSLDEDLPEPKRVEDVPNQDLHGAAVPDMLIVTHPLFNEQAIRLSQLHHEKSGLQSLIVEPQEIYNEFSSGQPDVSAIRDFARYLYQKDDRFKYLLLFGDGSYDNRTNDSDNSNYIITYQSENSINISASYTSDDFFGFLDDNEGEYIQINKLDIGIGRLTVGSQQEAKQLVDKIETYMFNPYLSPWKATLTFVGDDGDSNLHMRHADLLSQKVQNEHPEFDIKKIYFDSYKKTTTSSGDRYPDVNQAVQEAFAEGTLVFNYTGHGSEKQLAHENILSIGDIQKLSNKDRLPVFVTATCEFSRYDDKNLTEGSAGEIVLKTPNGGGVALLTTTRIAWSNSNFDINSNLYNHIFEEDENGEKLRLGDIVQRTKIASNSSVNKLNFTLLGDPALQLNYPTNKIFIDQINGESNPDQQDTLKALTQVNLEGRIENGEGGLFNKGSVTLKVFDKAVNVASIGNGGAVPFEYEVYQNRIFKGDVDVVSDRFNATFIVPKDIRYNVGNGRVSFYGADDKQMEAFGANNNIKVGSVSNDPPNDQVGPEITIWLNNVNFRNGGVTGTRPVLYAEFYDESGINTSGVGIGHDLSLSINEDRSNALMLNDYYSSESNDFTRGTLKYQLPAMESGRHILHLKAWDNLNNSSTVALEFTVQLSGELKLEDIKIYPNPVLLNETIKISFTHDAPNSMLDTSLKLYDLSGRLIDQVNLTVPSFGNGVTPIDYQVPDNLRKGLYILQGQFKAEEGQEGRFSKKILINR